MSQKTKIKLQTVIPLFFLTISLLILLIILASLTKPPMAAAQATDDSIIYLPLVYKFATPTPPPTLYYDNFSDKNSGWSVNDDMSSNCPAKYIDGVYAVGASQHTSCFYSAPHKAEYTYGVFEVTARRISNYYGPTSTRFSYGIFINEGDNQRNYYLFKIGYDDDEEKCHWELIRKKNSREARIKDGSCRSNHYDSNNTIKIKHSYDGVIAVYLNDRLLGTYEDDAQLTFRGSGVYVEERSNDRHIIIVFDDFVVRSL